MRVMATAHEGGMVAPVGTSCPRGAQGPRRNPFSLALGPLRVGSHQAEEGGLGARPSV
jgi:hypothetical protein